MADRAGAERACKDPNPIIDGRKANVNLAYLGAKPRIMQPGETSTFIISFTVSYDSGCCCHGNGDFRSHVFCVSNSFYPVNLLFDFVGAFTKTDHNTSFFL